MTTKSCHNVAQTADVTADVIHTTTSPTSACTLCQTRLYKERTLEERRKQTWRRRSYISTVFHFSLSVLILFVSVHIVSCQNMITPSVSSSSTYLVESKSANLTCTLSTTATPTTSEFPLSWDRSGGLPSSATTTTSQQAGSGGAITYLSMLTFVPTALDNEVNIVCNASIGNLTDSSSYAPLVILLPHEPVITGPDTVDAFENNTWTCKADGASRLAPNVYWRNGRGEALTTGVSKTTIIGQEPNKNMVYNITQTITLPLPATAALYNLSCIVVHELGQYNSRKTSTKAIIVYFPPQITKTGGDIINTNEGQRPTLSCIIIVSNPPATSVAWTKDGEPIDLSNGRFGPVNTSSASLTILSALRSDHGNYVCTATNPEGSTSFTTPTQLIVRYPPTINSSGNGTTVEGSAGGSLTIPCPVDAVPPPSVILWKRIINGQAEVLNVTGNSRYSGGSAANQQYDLVINPVQGDDAGTYFCEAVNDVGTGTGPNVTTVVNYNPVVTVPISLEVKEGDSFTISCKITMYPAVTSVVWFKGNTQINIPGSSGKYSGGTVQNQSLSVSSAVKADSATYKCQGSNGTASVSGTTVVTVTYAPKVSVPTSNIIGNVGQTATIRCIVDASPAATSVVWLRHAIGGSNSTATTVTIGGRFSGGSIVVPSLTISDLEATDMATYYCVVSNSVGDSTSSPVNLQVHYKPFVQVTSTPAFVKIGETFQLTCTADAYPAVTQIVWYQGNMEVSGTPNYTKQQASISDYTDFRCSASNSIGSSAATIRPNIQFTPQLVGTGQVTVTAKKSTSITLECLVFANPDPTSYAWYKGGNLTLGASQKTMSVLLSNETDFGAYSCSAENIVGNLNPAREFIVVEDKGTSTKDSGLSTPMIILIVFVILIFLIILALLILCCCLYGICAKKRKKSKVNPSETADPKNYEGDNGKLSRDSSLPPLDSKPNGNITVNDGFPTPRSKLPAIKNRGSIISVPEVPEPRAYRLPPLDPEAATSNLREDEKRRSRKKKHKKYKSEDKSALTGSEERADTTSPMT